MILARAWTRQLSAGLGAALIVPGALVGALVVLAFAGGFGRLGALGQAFSGPPVPAALHGAAPGQAGRASAVTSLAALAAVSVGASIAVTGTRSAVSGPAHAPASGAAPIGHRHATTGGSTGGRSPARTPAPTRPAPASPRPQPTPIDGIVSAGSSVTRQLPAPAGPTATGALGSAGSTLDGVVPPAGP